VIVAEYAGYGLRDGAVGEQNLVADAEETTHQNTESVLVVYPTHVMRIEPLSHSLFRMRAHVTPRKHERDGQQDRQPHYKANH
jgi:hypothetical protein